MSYVLSPKILRKIIEYLFSGLNKNRRKLPIRNGIAKRKQWLDNEDMSQNLANRPCLRTICIFLFYENEIALDSVETLQLEVNGWVSNVMMSE